MWVHVETADDSHRLSDGRENWLWPEHEPSVKHENKWVLNLFEARWKLWLEKHLLQSKCDITQQWHDNKVDRIHVLAEQLGRNRDILFWNPVGSFFSLFSLCSVDKCQAVTDFGPIPILPLSPTLHLPLSPWTSVLSVMGKGWKPSPRTRDATRLPLCHHP